MADLLAEPFDPKEIKFKPQMVKNNRCLAMAYIDARLVQDRLDETLGVDGWCDDYVLMPDGSVMCRLSVRFEPGGPWVTKVDVGSPSEQPDEHDRLKAAFSDALKRAAVKFGIGRYLYRLSAEWVDYDPVKKRITQVPQLPAWALPFVGTPANSKAASAKDGKKEAAKAAKKPQVASSVEEARNALYNTTHSEWEKLLTAIETPDELSATMVKFAQYEDGLKAHIWPLIKAFYADKGWLLDAATKRFQLARQH